MNSQKLLIAFAIALAIIFAILFGESLLWVLLILGVILALINIHRVSAKKTQAKNVTNIFPGNIFTNKCVNCGKQYNAKAIKKTWSVNGQMFFCSWECDLEWSRKRSGSLVKPTREETVGKQDEDL